MILAAIINGLAFTDFATMPISFASIGHIVTVNRLLMDFIISYTLEDYPRVVRCSWLLSHLILYYLISPYLINYKSSTFFDSLSLI